MSDKEKPEPSVKRLLAIFLKSIGIIFSIYIIYVFLTIIISGLGMHGRPKQYCSAAESDAQNIAAAIADYFAIPEHTTLPTISGESEYLGFTLSSKGGQNIAWVTGNAESTITIIVKDGSGKCPDDYQEGSPEWDAGRYTLEMK